MKAKYRFTAVLLLSVAACAALFVRVYGTGRQAERAGGEGILAVASFYPVYVAAEQVAGGCENIRIECLSEPQSGCLHDFVLTPEDMQLLSSADLFLVNGGGMETFLEEVAAQYPSLTVAETADGLVSEENAHAWMGIAKYRAQVDAVLNALCKASEDDAPQLKANAAAYDAKLMTLKEQQEALRDVLAGSKVISFHEAYEYLAEDYGLEIVYTLDLDEERQVSAGEVADVLKTVKEEGVRVILAEELYGADMAETIRKEADVAVCFLDTLVRGDYGADSYIDGMQQNINLLKEAFGVN